MSRINKLRWLRGGLTVAAGGWLFQTGCAIDPDLLLQAGIQLFTEAAIFFTDNALAGRI